MNMVMILPSRSRPEKIEASIDGWRANSTTTDLLVCLDDDDPDLDAYLIHDDVRYRIGKRAMMCPTVNEAAVEEMDRYDYIGFMGDDHVIRTPGWDQTMIDTIGEWGIGYGDDKLQGRNLATAAVLSSNIVRTIGYMAIPGLVHMYMDNFWMALGSQCRFLHYLPDVIIEHMHYSVGKSAEDEQYTMVNAPGMYAHDADVFQSWVNTQMTQDVVKICGAMDA